jgi:uncharacterized protein (TIGR02231 family)
MGARATVFGVIALGLVGGGTLGAAGRVDSVTVYRGQAEVVRVVQAPTGTGATEIVVTDLPECIIPESLYANGAEGVRIRAVRYRAQPVAEAPRKDVRAIEQQIRQLEQTLRENQQMQEVLAKKQALLDNLQSLSAVKSQVEKEGLKAEELKKLAQFVFQQREELARDLLKLQKEEKELNEQLSPLLRERANLTQTVSRTAREAVILIEKEKAGAADLRLGYLVSGVEWTPTYNIRAATGKAEVEVECNASIQQMSGEDWENARLTLSTATPTLASDPPDLAPFWVTLTSAGQPARDVLSLERERREAEERFRAAQSDRIRQQAEAIANSAAADVSLLLLEGKAKSAAQPGPVSGKQGETPLAVNYPLPGRHSLKSRSDRQAIRIASCNLPGEFYHLGVPVLTQYVYRQAQITNTSGMVFLEGKANAYVNGQFAGTGTLPLARSGQRFRVGFGVDTTLAVRQEMRDRQERLIGGNKEQVYTYQLLLENFGEKPVTVRVLDRIPVVRDSTIRVSLLDTSLPLSKDATYGQLQKPDNVLRWDVEVPAGATETRAFAIEYKFKLEFDKNSQISPARSTTPLFAVLNPREAWIVEEGWSRDETNLSWKPATEEEEDLLAVTLVRGSDGKNVVGRRVEGNLSGYRWLVLGLENKGDAGIRVAVGLSVGKEWTYYESMPRYLRSGESSDVAFDLTASTYKMKGTGWEFSARPEQLEDARAIYVVFYPNANGTVNLRGLKLVK